MQSVDNIRCFLVKQFTPEVQTCCVTAGFFITEVENILGDFGTQFELKRKWEEFTTAVMGSLPDSVHLILRLQNPECGGAYLIENTFGTVFQCIANKGATKSLAEAIFNAVFKLSGGVEAVKVPLNYQYKRPDTEVQLQVNIGDLLQVFDWCEGSDGVSSDTVIDNLIHITNGYCEFQDNEGSCKFSVYRKVRGKVQQLFTSSDSTICQCLKEMLSEYTKTGGVAIG